MHCPACGKEVAVSIDQVAVTFTSVVSGYVVISPALVTILFLPWALPALAGGMGYLYLRRRRCSSCGAKFNLFRGSKT